MADSDVADALLAWVQGFAGVTVPTATWEDLADGVALSEMMAAIVGGQLELGLVKYGAGGNVRLRTSNLRRLLDTVLDFYAEEFGQDPQALPQPDIGAIAEAASVHDLACLVRLVLGTAVFSAHKEEYIAGILGLEEHVQIALMAVIQQMMAEYPALLAASNEGPEASQRRAWQDETEQGLRQELAEVRALLAAAEEQRQAARQDVQALRDTVHVLEGQRDELQGHIHVLERFEDKDTPSGKLICELRGQVQQLEERLAVADSDRDLYGRQASALRDDLAALQRQYEAALDEAAVCRHYRDEADMLRAQAGRADTLQRQVDTYRAKVQEMGELKRQIRELEEANADYIQQKDDLEERLQRVQSQRSQLASERQDAVALAADQQTLADALQQAQQQVQQLQALCSGHERASAQLEATARDLRDRLQQAEEAALLAATKEPGQDSLQAELGGTKDTVTRLEREVAALRSKCRRLAEERDSADKRVAAILAGGQGAALAVGAEMAAANERLLQTQQQLADMTEKYNALLADKGGSGAKEREYLEQVAGLLLENKRLTDENRAWQGDMDAMTMRLNELRQTNASLRDSHAQMQLHLQRAQQGAAHSDVQAHLQRLQGQLVDKDHELHAMGARLDKVQALWAREQQLVASAVYGLGMDLQRLAVHTRLPGAEAGSVSLLSSQRRSAARQYASLATPAPGPQAQAGLQAPPSHGGTGLGPSSTAV